MSLAPRRPGRPPDAVKREAIVAATRALIARHGLDFSMENVAVLAGVSRQTVYNSYPSREALLNSIFELSLEDISRPLAQPEAGATLADVLTDFGMRYLDLVTSPDRIGMLRMLAATKGAGQEHSSAFYTAGPRRMRQRLTTYLLRQPEMAHLDELQVQQAADLFFSMIAGTRQLRGLLGIAEPEGLEDALVRVRLAVRIFLDGLKTRPDP